MTPINIGPGFVFLRSLKAKQFNEMTIAGNVNNSNNDSNDVYMLVSVFIFIAQVLMVIVVSIPSPMWRPATSDVGIVTS